MSEEKQKMKIMFAPGALEQLEAENTPEELQSLFDHLSELLDDGTLLDQSSIVDMDELLENDPELYHQLQKQLHGLEDIDRPTFH